MVWSANFLQRLGRGMVLQIGLGRVHVIVDGEQLALDQVGLHRRAHPDGEIGLALGQVQFPVVHHQMDFHFGILRQECAQPRQQPIGADAMAGGDLQASRAARHGHS